MRLEENKIKQAILHPNSEVRYTAVEYFSESFSMDTTVISLVIQAVEMFGWQHAYSLIGRGTNLLHTEESIDWILSELNREIDQNEMDQVNYLFNLSRMLLLAQPGLLFQHEADIIESRGLLPGYKNAILERLKMLSWDGETCWNALEEFCEAGKDKQYMNDVNLGYASLIIEALARDGEKYTERMLSLLKLSSEIDDFEKNPMKWMEPLLVELAGEMRLEAAIPIIIEKLKIDADFLAQQCMYALTKIGTDSVVQAIYNSFPNSDSHFCLYASGALEDIHSDLVVEKSLKLLSKEKDVTIKTCLGRNLLSNFAFEGIDVVRHLVKREDYDSLLINLREKLITTCIIMEERFPEFDKWKAQVAQEEKERQQIVKRRMQMEPMDALRDALQSKKSNNLKRKSGQQKDSNQFFSTDFSNTKKIRRNDPCPCGSGKKYKKCCF